MTHPPSDRAPPPPTSRPYVGVQARPVRVAVIGAGHVGATFAYALLQSGLAAEIVMVDPDRDRVRGEVMDLADAVPFLSPARVWAGGPSDCAGAVVTVVTAGGAQRPGQTRLDLLRENADLFETIIPEVARQNPGGMILVATNPVDLLTRLAIARSGLPPGWVMGSGTILDTSRLRARLGRLCGVDPRSVHGYVIGEHGESEVIALSTVTVAGLKLATYCAAAHLTCDAPTLAALVNETRGAAGEIIALKGATSYAIAAGLVRIVEAIVRDQHTVLTLSSQMEDPRFGAPGLCMSLPTVISAAGVEMVLPVALASGEQSALLESARILQAAWTQVTAAEHGRAAAASA